MGGAVRRSGMDMPFPFIFRAIFPIRPNPTSFLEVQGGVTLFSIY